MGPGDSTNNESGDQNDRPISDDFESRLQGYLEPVDCGSLTQLATPEQQDVEIGGDSWLLQDPEADAEVEGRHVILTPNLVNWGNGHSEIQSPAIAWEDNVAFDIMTKLEETHRADDHQITIEMRFLDDPSMPNLASIFKINSRISGVFTTSCTQNTSNEEASTDNQRNCSDELLSEEDMAYRGPLSIFKS